MKQPKQPVHVITVTARGDGYESSLDADTREYGRSHLEAIGRLVMRNQERLGIEVKE